MRRSYCCQNTFLTLLLGLGFLFSNLSAQPQDPLEKSVGDAILQQNYSEALGLLVQMGISPSSEDLFLLRQKAFCLIQEKQFTRALRIADRILVLDPSDSYAAFYRAQALAGMKQSNAAAQQLQKVMQQASTSPAAQLVQKEMPEVAQQLTVIDEGKPAEIDLRAPSINRWSGRASTNLGYDTNPAYRPNGQGASGGAFWDGSLRLSYAIIDQMLDSRPLSLTWEASAFANRALDSKFSDFDYTVLDTFGRVSRKLQTFGKDIEIALRGGLRTTWLGDRPYYTSWILGGEIEKSLTARVTSFLNYEWSSQDFKESVEFPQFFGRDGSYHQLQAGLSSWVIPRRLWLRAGYNFSYYDTDGTQLQREAHGAFLAGFLELPASFKLGLSVSYGNSRYLKYLPIPERADDLWDLSVSLRRSLFTERLEAVAGFRHLASRSNQDFAKYRRSIFTLGLQYRF